MSNDELSIVTEVGIFGDLNISDPTKKKIDPRDDAMIALIEDFNKINVENLTQKFNTNE